MSACRCFVVVCTLLSMGCASVNSPEETYNEVSLGDWLAALDHEDAGTRVDAVKALTRIAVAIPKALGTAMGDGDPWVRALAVQATAMARESAGSTIPNLTGVLSTDSDPTNRALAAQSLGVVAAPQIHPRSGGLVMKLNEEGAVVGAGVDFEWELLPLVAALKDDNLIVRTAAAQALGRIGADARLLGVSSAEWLAERARLKKGEPAPTKVELSAAESALQELLELLKDSQEENSEHARSVVAEALLRIRSGQLSAFLDQKTIQRGPL